MERNENVEKLLATVTKLGFSDEVKTQIKDHMNNALGEFSAYEQMQMGNDLVGYKLNFSPSKNADNTNVYLNGVDVMLEKAVNVPHKTILGLDTQEVETLLMNKPNAELMNISNKAEFDNLLFVHSAKVEEKMKFLSENAPEVFNALYVKYKPEVDAMITPEMATQQEELQKGLWKVNSFSTYYNLTKLELYTAMDGGASFKTLFKVNKEDQAQSLLGDQKQDNKYKAWVRVDFNSKRADGSFEMKMFHENRNFDLREVLADYNFKETSNRFDRAEVIKFLQKGCKVTLTNLGESGERQVNVRANPEFKNLDLFKLSGEPIKSVNTYRKNPLAVEVGAAVSLKKADDVRMPAQQESMSLEMKSEMSTRINSMKSAANVEQKKTPDTKENAQTNSEQNRSNSRKQEKNVKEGAIDRRTRFTSRTVKESDAKQGLSR